MHNVQELERKWIKYKIKSYSLYIALVVFLIISVPLTTFFFPTALHVSENNITTESTKSMVFADLNNSKKVVEVNQTDTNLTNDKLVLQPSLGFMDNMGSSTNTYYDDQPTQVSVTKVQNVAQTQMKQIPEKKVIAEPAMPIVKPTNSVVQAPKEVKNKKISIEVHNMDDDMQDVIQRFKKTNNPTLGVFLAKKYYEMKQYNLSYNYALQTNQLDSKVDMSWIIFTKSLVKLGQKEKAITTLKSYINNSHSKQAIALLDEIESGRFK
jgi:hypothetical protein